MPLLPRPLEEYPVKNGFRMRGMDMTRIETFTDAAFAFAATLLVVSIDAIPTSSAELMKAMQGVPAFALSFTMLMMFWFGHWSWSRRYGLEDGPTILLSCTLVFVVLCYVYPLKFIFSGMVFFFSGGRLHAGLDPDGSYDLYESFAIYGIGFCAMTLVILLLHVHAYRRRAALQLTAVELFDTRADIVAWSIMTIVGLLSITFALTTEPSALVLPGYTYMLLAIVMPWLGVSASRRRAKRFGTFDQPDA